MWYNEKKDINEWFYALPAGETDADIDRAEDWLATRQELIEYANNSPIFKSY